MIVAPEQFEAIGAAGVARIGGPRAQRAVALEDVRQVRNARRVPVSAQVVAVRFEESPVVDHTVEVHHAAAGPVAGRACVPGGRRRRRAVGSRGSTGRRRGRAAAWGPGFPATKPGV